MDKIQVKQVSFAYEEGAQVLDHLNFSVQAGECVGIVGESGCGKSTLGHILCGIIPNVTGGQLYGDVLYDGVSIRGKSLAEISRKVGFVMQDPLRQLVTTTVEDELAFGPENLCMPPEEIRAKVDQGLTLFGLQNQRLQDPASLSGGQMQLTAMASVWTMSPDIMILDEPFSHLDSEGCESVLSMIQILLRENTTVLISEHNFQFLTKTDRVLWIQDGSVREEGQAKEIQKAYESYFR